MTKLNKVVITAGGLGTRFYPLTRSQPKEMLPVLDKPVIQYVVEEAVNSGLDEILIIVGKGKDSIIDYFDRNSLEDRFVDSTIDQLPEIYFVRQKEQIGLGDSIKYARKFVDDQDFVIMLGDTIYLSNSSETVTSQLISKFKEHGPPIIAVEKVQDSKIHDYGIISGKQVGRNTWLIEDMVEKPTFEEAPSNIGVTGTYILSEDVFDYLDNLIPGRNGEYQLTDALNMMCHKRKTLGIEFEGTRYDIGDKESWVKTFMLFALQDERFRNLL